MTLSTMTRGMAVRAVAVLSVFVVLAAMVSVQPSDAFAPTNLKAINSKSHQHITETAVKAVDLEFFSKGKLTRSMTKAMDAMVKANVAVDDDQVQSALHFDGENFAGGQARIVGLLDRVVTDLEAGDGGQARSDLGGALHTIQDFYAHSNWVELGNAGASGDLGVPGRVLGPVAGPTEPTCDGRRLITTKLTSGYYSGSDARPVITTKCRHGGPFDRSAGSGGINKDLTRSIFSPHSAFHSAAAAAALQATTQFLRDIKAKVTPRQLKLLFGVGPTLGFSIDTTGSMGSVINGVKSQATKMVNERIGTDEEPSKYVLAPFNDPGVGPVSSTDDPAVFKSALNGLGADGGGDCPELSMTGALQALGQMDEGSDLFLFTDADAKDSGLAGSVASLAASKDVVVYPFIFGNCSGAKARSQTAQRAATGARATFTLDPTYTQLAQATGGQALSLDVAAAGDITGLADALVRANAVSVLNQTIDLSSGTQSVTVPVDPSMSALTVAMSGPYSRAVSVKLVRPDGTTVAPSDPGVTVISPAGGSAPATAISTTAPVVGPWTVKLSGDGIVSLRASGEATLDLSRFDFVPVESVSPDPSRGGASTLPGLPVSGQPVGAVAMLTDGVSNARFDLRAPDGTLVAPLELPTHVGSEYAGVVTPPAGSFLVYASGKDSAGHPFQRVIDAPVVAQPLVVTPPPSTTLVAGVPTTFTFSVHNFGVADTFAVTATDDRGFFSGLDPASLTIPAGGTKTVAVTLTPPDDAIDGLADTLAVDVASTTRPSVHNYAVLTNGVSSDDTPPTVTAIVNPKPNAAGWNNSTPTVTISATDTGSGVASITYSARGAQTIKPTTAPQSTVPITITKRGKTTVSFSATDVAGNVATTQTLTVRYDGQSPVLACRAAPRRINADGSVVPVSVAVSVADSGSGAASFYLSGIKVNQATKPGDLRGFEVGTRGIRGSVRAVVTESAPTRTYTLTYLGRDVAGNTATCTTRITVVAPPP